MRNKWLNKGLLLLIVGCLSFSMTGCKGKEFLDHALEKVHLKTVQETESKEAKKEIEPEVPVEKPEFITNLSGSVSYQVGASAEALTVEATTTDEGEISYQWYKSLTNTNGGGTIIDGATENTYTPSTETAGTVYYYVVATSTIKSSTNRITSETVEVIISEVQEGEPATEEAPAEETPAEGEQPTEETPAESTEQPVEAAPEQPAE